MEGVVRAQQGSQASACFVGLVPAFWCQFYAVVGDRLVYVAVFWWVGRKSVAVFSLYCGEHAGERLHIASIRMESGAIKRREKNLLLPSDCPCRISIIMRGFPILNSFLSLT